MEVSVKKERNVTCAIRMEMFQSIVNVFCILDIRQYINIQMVNFKYLQAPAENELK